MVSLKTNRQGYRFPLQNVGNSGAEHWGRMKDTGADRGTVRNGSNVYKLILSLEKALTIQKKCIEFFRWYKLKWRDMLIFWSLSLLKPQLIFSIRSTCRFLAVSCQGRRKSEKRTQNPLFWLLLLTMNLSVFSIYNSHLILLTLLTLPATLRLGRQFYTVPFWAQSISQDSLESNEVTYWPCCDPEYNESHYACSSGGVKTHACLETWWLSLNSMLNGQRIVVPMLEKETDLTFFVDNLALL